MTPHLGAAPLSLTDSSVTSRCLGVWGDCRRGWEQGQLALHGRLVLQLLTQGLELCFLCDFNGPQIHRDGKRASLVQRRYMAPPPLICTLFCSSFLCHVPAPLPGSLALRCTSCFGLNCAADPGGSGPHASLCALSVPP